MKYLLLELALLLGLNSISFGQTNKAENVFSFMFYNTENFFDCDDDSITNDDEFTPGGTRRWNWGRFQAKADRLSKVIIAAGKWNSPVLIGLCEIENLQVLEKFTNNLLLRKSNYQIIQKDSRDERGIDVALIYRSEYFKPLKYDAIPVLNPQDNSFKTRDILYVQGILNGGDTLHIFVNHWPSRYGGVMETIKYRALAARTLKNAIDKIQEENILAKIICMGDFNDSPKDESIMQELGTTSNEIPDILGELINLSFSWCDKPVQTIKSQYSWDVFDQWIVSDSFLNNNKSYQYINAEIFSPDFILEQDRKFGGIKPKRTYVGFKYQEGFSDHLPILLRFKFLNH